MIIGIGHKARQGKDIISEFLKRKYGFIILRFSDALREECRNCYIDYDGCDMWTPPYKGKITIKLKSDKDKQFHIFWGELPKYFQEWWMKNSMGIYYNGMTEKDSILMQWWETDFRRKQDENYWVKKVRDKIGYIELANSKPQNGTSTGDRMIIKSNIVIPDMRFKNETKMIKNFGGKVWKVERYDKKLEIEFHTNWETMQEFRYIDPSRDPNHESEIALDDYSNWDNILINDGTLDDLYKKVDKIMEEIKS